VKSCIEDHDDHAKRVENWLRGKRKERVRSIEWRFFDKGKFKESKVELTIEEIAYDGHFH
jgi:hypothetical protein